MATNLPLSLAVHHELVLSDLLRHQVRYVDLHSITNGIRIYKIEFEQILKVQRNCMRKWLRYPWLLLLLHGLLCLTIYLWHQVELLISWLRKKILEPDFQTVLHDMPASSQKFTAGVPEPCSCMALIGSVKILAGITLSSDLAV